MDLPGRSQLHGHVYFILPLSFFFCTSSKAKEVEGDQEMAYVYMEKDYRVNKTESTGITRLNLAECEKYSGRNTSPFPDYNNGLTTQKYRTRLPY